MNDNGVTSADHARNYLDSAREAQRHLNAKHIDPESRRAEVVALRSSVGFALKAAEVYATLAIAEAVRDATDADALVEVAERWGGLSRGVPPVSAGVQA